MSAQIGGRADVGAHPSADPPSGSRPGRAPVILFAVTVDVSLVFIDGLASAFRSQGWEVHIVSAPGPRLQEVAHRDGVRVHPVHMRREPAPLADVMALRELVRVLRAVRPDVLYAGTPKAGLLAMVAGRVVGVPSRYYVLHGLRLEGARGVGRSLLSLFERASLRLATHTFAVSRSVRERVLHLRLTTADRISVIGSGSANGIDLARFRPSGWPSDELRQRRSDTGLDPALPTVGFVGRLTRDKGLDVLATALDEVEAGGRRVQLLVVGGVDDASGQAVVARLEGGRFRLTMTGHVLDPSSYYPVMDVLCLPSYREGFPTVVLEASASGLPVVVSDATGVVDAVLPGRTGLVVPVGRPDALARALERLIDQPAVRREMGDQGVDWVTTSLSRSVVVSAVVDEVERRHDVQRLVAHG